MRCLGKLSYFLGIKFVKFKEGIIMYQHKYIRELLDIFEMIDCNNVTSPSEIDAKLDECSNKEKIDEAMFKKL